MVMKSSKSIYASIIVALILPAFIFFPTHIILLNNNVYGEWKHSGGCDDVPDFLYIEPGNEINHILFLKGVIYKDGKKYAIPLFCTKNNMIICCLHKYGWGVYSKKGDKEKS